MIKTLSIAEQISNEIPTEYAGNMVSMDVSADLNGQPLRVWCHPNYAGQTGYWKLGADPASIEINDGDILTVRSSGSESNHSWDWTRRWVVAGANLQPLNP